MKLGIDLGSRFVKIVYGEDISSIKYQKFDTIEFYKQYCSRMAGLMHINLDNINPGFKFITSVTSTGYGRGLVDIKRGSAITELEAHTNGAIVSVKEIDFTILDLGGQDNKVIKVINNQMVDFIMNDKCASGSGRYLENMARVLGVPINKFGEYYKNPLELSNTCAIYGESEIIGHIVDGQTPERIASSVNYSVFNMVKRHLKDFENEVIVFVGGLAKNKAIRYFIETELGKRVIIPKNPEYNAAVGCFVNDATASS
ncbi:MAG: acyl-CoA dehydratase activase [Elusimicrobiota bacterium]